MGKFLRGICSGDDGRVLVDVLEKNFGFSGFWFWIASCLVFDFFLLHCLKHDIIEIMNAKTKNLQKVYAMYFFMFKNFSK